MSKKNKRLPVTGDSFSDINIDDYDIQGRRVTKQLYDEIKAGLIPKKNKTDISPGLSPKSPVKTTRSIHPKAIKKPGEPMIPEADYNGVRMTIGEAVRRFKHSLWYKNAFTCPWCGDSINLVVGSDSQYFKHDPKTAADHRFCDHYSGYKEWKPIAKCSSRLHEQREKELSYYIYITNDGTISHYFSIPSFSSISDDASKTCVDVTNYGKRYPVTKFTNSLSHYKFYNHKMDVSFNLEYNKLKNTIYFKGYKEKSIYIMKYSYDHILLKRISEVLGLGIPYYVLTTEKILSTDSMSVNLIKNINAHMLYEIMFNEINTSTISFCDDRNCILERYAKTSPQNSELLDAMLEAINNGDTKSGNELVIFKQNQIMPYTVSMNSSKKIITIQDEGKAIQLSLTDREILEFNKNNWIKWNDYYIYTCDDDFNKYNDEVFRTLKLLKSIIVKTTFYGNEVTNVTVRYDGRYHIIAQTMDLIISTNLINIINKKGFFHIKPFFLFDPYRLPTDSRKYSWIKVGCKVKHTFNGSGVVTKVLEDCIFIKYGKSSIESRYSFDTIDKDKNLIISKLE